MDAVRKIVENSSNPLSIVLPKEYENRKLEIIVLPLDNDSLAKTEKKYHFADLAGQLEWDGNALDEQKKLRDEWE
ncbi:hypothetical protein [Niabella sp.]|uniref:hypothetical protein n=1 Tax=Niabella sp. TaxID=1962976 RepID=UPI002622F2AD|nr:hypothetical protein [Niabella sp.]